MEMATTVTVAVKLVAEGRNSFQTDKRPEGTVKYLEDPQDVVSLIRNGELKNHILLVRDANAVFLAPALSLGAVGVLALAGPFQCSCCRSDLRILARGLRIPCAWGLRLTGDQAFFATQEEQWHAVVERLQGRRVVVDASDHDVVRVYERVPVAESVLSS